MGIEDPQFDNNKESAWANLEQMMRETGPPAFDPLEESIRRVRMAFDESWKDFEEISIVVHSQNRDEAVREAVESTAAAYRERLVEMFMRLAARELKIMRLERVIEDLHEEL
jgi:hypothetical protein